MLFGNTVNCLLIDTSKKRSPKALLQSVSVALRQSGFFLEEKGGPLIVRVVLREEHLWLLTMRPGLLFQCQCLYDVLSLLVLAFATRGFSPTTRIFPYPYIYLFFTDLPVDMYVCLPVECSIEGLERCNQNSKSDLMLISDHLDYLFMLCTYLFIVLICRI